MHSIAKLLRLGRVRYHQVKPIREHRHDFFHIIYVLEGKGLVLLNDELYELSAGDVHVYHPAWTHDVWAQPYAEFATLDLRFVVPDPTIRKQTEALPPFVAAGPLAERLRNLVREIEVLGTRQTNPFWREAANAYLTLLLALLMEQREQHGLTAAGSSSSVPVQALNIMVDSLPSGISVSELAERVYTTPTNLTTLFKAHFGQTVQELMIQLKIDYAKHMLATNPNVKINHLAKQLGWGDPRYFRRHFQNLTGMTPSAFAERFSQHGESGGTSESWLIFENDPPLEWTQVAAIPHHIVRDRMKTACSLNESGS